MTEDNGNGRVTLAELKIDVSHVWRRMDDMAADHRADMALMRGEIRGIKDVLLKIGLFVILAVIGSLMVQAGLK